MTEIPMTQAIKLQLLVSHLFLLLEHWRLGFVSDFDIRISKLRKSVSKLSLGRVTPKPGPPYLRAVGSTSRKPGWKLSEDSIL